MEEKIQLSLLQDQYSVCKLAPEATLPTWALDSPFYSISRTNVELSIVCQSHLVPADVTKESNWIVIEVQGPLDFNLTGILYSLTKPLANKKISIFAISTFETDYLMVKKDRLVEAQKVLLEAGFSFL